MVVVEVLEVDIVDDEVREGVVLVKDFVLLELLVVLLAVVDVLVPVPELVVDVSDEVEVDMCVIDTTSSKGFRKLNNSKVSRAI